MVIYYIRSYFIELYNIFFSVFIYSIKIDKMNVYIRVCLLILGLFLFISVGLNECVSIYFYCYIWLV